MKNDFKSMLRQSQGVSELIRGCVPAIFRPEAGQMVNGVLILDALPTFGDAHPQDPAFRAVGCQIQWEASDGIKALVMWSDGNDEGELQCWVPKAAPASHAG